MADFDLTVGGSYSGAGRFEDLKGSAARYVQGYELPLLILVSIFLIYIVWKLMVSEKFNPTQTMKYLKLDDLGRGEHAVGGPAAGSAAYQILNSSDYDCANRKPMGDDAWAWQFGVAGAPERMHSAPSDNEFTQIMSGH